MSYGVVMNANSYVEAIGTIFIQFKERTADANAAMVRAGVAEHVVVGDLQLMRVAVDKNAATRVAARNREAIDSDSAARKLWAAGATTVIAAPSSVSKPAAPPTGTAEHPRLVSSRTEAEQAVHLDAPLDDPSVGRFTPLIELNQHLHPASEQAST